MFGIRKKLEQHYIPTPTTLMAQMLVLKIARMEGLLFDDGHMTVTLDLGTKGVLEVRTSPLYNRGRFAAYSLRVGLMGDHPYRTIELSDEEEAMLIQAMRDAHKRTADKISLQKEASSQQWALDIIEGLIQPPPLPPEASPPNL